MHKQGTVVRWDAARGFGFIRCADSQADVFFHVRDFRAAGTSPVDGMTVAYEEIHVGGKGPRAMAVRPAGAPQFAGSRRDAPPRQRRQTEPRAAEAPGALSTLWMLTLIVAYAGMLVWGTTAQRLPIPVLLALPVLNVLTFVTYWKDKFAARQQAWRTSEQTLHVLSLLGGWPGAWFGQRVLRHKSRKASFRETYRVTVAAHLAALVAWLWFAPALHR